MPFFRGTLLFEFVNQPPCGFTESFGFISATGLSAGTEVAAWPNQRRVFLSSDWKITGFRVAEVTSFLKPASGSNPAVCKFKYKPVNINACAAPVLGLLGNADTPYTAVLFDFFRSDRIHSRQYMARGIPDTWWAGGSLNIPVPDQAVMLTWFNYMKTVPGFGALDRGPNNLGPPKTDPTTCTITLHPYQSLCPKRVASRRIGRPFDLLRGARRKKRS
jgi:hypothetical protein